MCGRKNIKAKYFRQTSLVDWIHEKLVILKTRTKARTNVLAIWIITANDIRWRMYGRWKIEMVISFWMHDFYFARDLGLFLALTTPLMCIVQRCASLKLFFIHLPGETSAFFAILYYLWMFICCSTGVPLWNKSWLKSTTSRFDVVSLRLFMRFAFRAAVITMTISTVSLNRHGFTWIQFIRSN